MIDTCPRLFDQQLGAPPNLPQACRDNCPVAQGLDVPEDWFTAKGAARVFEVAPSSVTQAGRDGRLFRNDAHVSRLARKGRGVRWEITPYPYCALQAWLQGLDLKRQARAKAARDKVARDKARDAKQAERELADRERLEARARERERHTVLRLVPVRGVRLATRESQARRRATIEHAIRSAPQPLLVGTLWDIADRFSVSRQRIWAIKEEMK